MKPLGLTLITLGFLAGAYLSVTHQTEVAWLPWGVAVAAGFVGVALVHLARRAHARDDTRVSEDLAVLTRSLDRVVAEVAVLNAEKDALDPYDVGPRIDERLLDDLNAFADSREALSHAFGLAAYADVMAHFAGGERYLNRVWSASADGYIDEVHAYLGHALEQFTTARDKLRALEPV